MTFNFPARMNSSFTLFCFRKSFEQFSIFMKFSTFYWILRFFAFHLLCGSVKFTWQHTEIINSKLSFAIGIFNLLMCHIPCLRWFKTHKQNTCGESIQRCWNGNRPAKPASPPTQHSCNIKTLIQRQSLYTRTRMQKYEHNCTLTTHIFDA